ncbi:LPS export ABC transporter permease LptF [Leucothrix pacifica]|uniref:Lipopolysaccharide export system permease protein LptF n=1 Tax=Leucothrix pacifica TaxID=1247513 RepID=A0A317CUQ6_9GAMM|nr:LPS export ABC transporter permease LptF [Leucothrix pacifica]PWR00211.1 LPS export ABC transporter permease LptF [Leucothrix pacifica]
MILNRYLIKEILQAFIATLLILLLIIVGNTVARLLGDVSSGQLPSDALAVLVFIGSVKGAIQLAPIALLIGMMLAFGRMYRDNEVSALHASGVGPGQFFKAIFLLLFPLTVLLSVLVLHTLPLLESSRQNITNEIKQRPEASGIPVGEFMHSRSGNRSFTIFVETLDEKNVVMKKFFMQTENDNETQVMMAEQALLFIDKGSGERVLQINNGSRYDQKKSDDSFTVFTFSEHGIRVPSLATNTSQKLSAEPTLSLFKSTDIEEQAELHWRFGIILSAPIMALLAFPLSYTTPRQGRFGKLAIGILLYAIYANLLITGKSMLEDEKIPGMLGLWWVHIPFVLVALVMVWRRYGGLR